MRKKRAMREDPVVAEVRAIRTKLWQEAGASVDGLLRLLDRTVPRKRPARRSAR